ncbi:MAG TPA: kelch repeat-containing protein [Gemmatimonadales bacterium]
METPPLSRATTFTLRVRRGQEHAEAQATVEARYRNAFRILRDAPIAQTRHVAAPLPDGRSILMGGNTSETPNVPDSTLTQVFDPATETFARGPELLFSAAAHEFTSLVQLSNGGFLLAGGGINAGLGGRTSAATQMFDPAGARFVEVGDAVLTGISGRTSAPLGDGGALLTGGFVSNRAERYDPVEKKWRAVGNMLHVRGGHTATLLRDGRVLIAGGSTCCDQPAPSNLAYANTAEIYDPATDAFSATGSMEVARGLHAAALLPDGRVLISGGDGNDPAAPPLGAEIFDPATGRFSSAGNLLTPRDSHTAVTLTDGRVLVAGGEVPPLVAGSAGVGVPGTEIFDPAAGRWTEGPTIDRDFLAATVTMLSNGKVLVFGGEDRAGFPRANAALFE